ncbi:MAG: ABC transporter permease subunit [Synergistaceae bacterium]|jgi:phosphate transport system permease protein|nr:ABC transporter permease subunit [Synergistaceae bacterium]
MMKRREKFLLCLSWGSGLLICGAVGTLLVFLLARGGPVFGKELFFDSTPPMDALLGLKPVWNGIWPAVMGTFFLLSLTLAFAALPGIGCGVFLACYATPKQKYRLGLAVDLLAGIPSIVMGLFGFVLIVYLRRTVLPNGTTCLLLSSFCLALLVLPSLVVGTRTALETLPRYISLTAAALGFSHGQTVWRLLLPAAGQGILGGLMLALGRAAEDTAVIMLTGVVANAGLPSGLTSKFEALPFRIYYTAAQYATQRELDLGFGAALALLLLSGSLLLCAWGFQRGLERRWRGVR